jgi:hypothetical protein
VLVQDLLEFEYFCVCTSQCNLIYRLKILRAPGYFAVEATGCTLVPVWQFLYSRNFLLFQLVCDSKVCLEEQAEKTSGHTVYISYEK